MSTTQEQFGDDFGGERMWGLKELPYPDAIPLTPQTVGWLVVALLAAAGIGWLAWRLRRRWLANGYRRQAAAALDEMAADPAKAANLPYLLRRTALTAYERRHVAGLRGKDWIGWLNQSAGRPIFSEDAANLLDQLAYSDAPVQADRTLRLVEVSRNWVRCHRV